MNLTDQQKLEILCAYLPHGVEFKLPLSSDRFDSITEGEPWRMGMTIQDAIKENIYNASRYERMTLKQPNPSIMWEDGEIFLGQMTSSLGFEEDDVYLKEVLPILRHPDDMTEEELIQLGKFLWNDQGLNNNIARENATNWLKGYLKVSISPQWAINCLRYLQSIHVDTFGAIDARWAVMRNINEKG